MSCRPHFLAFVAISMTFAGTSALSRPKGPAPGDKPVEASQFFQAFDLNRDGKVAHEELNKALGTQFAATTHGRPSMTEGEFASHYAQRTRQRIAQMFHRLDRNGDGKLTLDEYAAPQRVRFEAFDRAGSGTESCRANPVQHASYGSARQTGAGRTRFCADHDLNRDGVVTHAEFDSATATRFATLAAGGPTMTAAQFTADMLAYYRNLSARIFERLDTDQSGALSLAEFAASEQKTFARMDRNRDGVVTRDELSSGNFDKSRMPRENR